MALDGTYHYMLGHAWLQGCGDSLHLVDRKPCRHGLKDCGESLQLVES